MKRMIRVLVCVLLCNAVNAQQKDIPGMLNDLFEKEFAGLNTGAVVLVAKNGKPIFTKAIGKANLELDAPMLVNSVLRIGSITKQFTAVAILQLAEKGKLDLNDEITKFIPNYPVNGQKITIEQILSHTSGIPNFSAVKAISVNDRADRKPSEVVDLFKNEPLRFTPGSKWEYSNAGYFLLGHLIEIISGKSYANYLQENIFTPAGMNATSVINESRIVKQRANSYTSGSKGLENPQYLNMSTPFAAGAIESTVEDLFRWNQALLSYKLLNKINLDKAFTRYRLSDGKETAYGYGWRMGYIQERPSLWHGGWITGFISMAMYLPADDVFVTVLTNCDCKSPEDITARLAAIAIGKPYGFKETAVAPATLLGFTGVYENQDGRLRIITLSNNRLFSQLGRGPKTEMKSYAGDRFFFEDDPFLNIVAVRNPQGQVESLVVNSRTAQELWKKTSRPQPSEDGIALGEDVLNRYLGVYEINAEFLLTVTKDKQRLYAQGTGQEKFEIFAESETSFFAKINDATFEFIPGADGKTGEVLIKQGGRNVRAVKKK